MYKTQSNSVPIQMVGKSNKQNRNRKAPIAKPVRQNEAKPAEVAPKKKTSFVFRQKSDEVTTVIEQIKSDDYQV